jgi:hypothetical protein
MKKFLMISNKYNISRYTIYKIYKNLNKIIINNKYLI